MPRAAVTCFKNRGLLSIPDVRRNPLIQVSSLEGLPRSALFVPLLALNDAVGVLQVDNAAHVGYFSRHDQEAVQHLANQAAAALRLQQQQHMREQLFRGEKLAATGYLISGIANELREPIENIARLTAAPNRTEPEPGAHELSDAVRRASEIVARLVSFANSENATPQEVDIAALLAGLVRFREPQWRANELRVQHRAGHGPALVLGVGSQLEQVFLTLLVHAEQRAAQSPIRTVTLQTSVLAGRVLVEIGHSAEPEALKPGAEEPEQEAIDMEVCTGIVRNHGGEIHMLRQSGLHGFEVDLPSAAKQNDFPIPAALARPLTLILVDPDRTAAHHLMAVLSRRGHRVVPARPEEAADLAQRLRFDAVLWSSGPGRGEWAQFRDRVRASVGAFILISDGYDRQLADSMEQNGSYLLARPVEEAALDRVLAEIASGAGFQPARDL